MEKKKEKNLKIYCFFLPTNLYTVVPQFGQVPLYASLPFLSVTSFGLFIVTTFLHFTQYAVIFSGISLHQKNNSLRVIKGYRYISLYFLYDILD